MILVTGAGGFVGRALCRDLQERGRPHRSTTRRGDDGTLAMGSIGPATDWSSALHRVDAVVHLMARVHHLGEDAENRAAEYRLANVDTTLALAGQAAARRIKRFIFLSTVKVNGEATEAGHRFRADDPPRPADDYARSKYDAEQRLFELGARTGMEIVAIRPPLVYGPGVKANFRAMLRWVAAGIPLPFGSVDNRRSLVAVENLTDLIVRCLDHSAAPGQTFMVSDGEDLSTPQLLQGLARSLGRPSRVFPCPPALLRAAARAARREERLRRLLDSLQVDAAATQQRLAWKPPYSVAAAFARAARAGWCAGGQD